MCFGQFVCSERLAIADSIPACTGLIIYCFIKLPQKIERLHVFTMSVHESRIDRVPMSGMSHFWLYTALNVYVLNLRYRGSAFVR